MRNVVYPIGALALVLAAWLFAVRYLHVAAYLLPAPYTVVERLLADFGFLMWQSAATTFVAVAGFLLSVVIGIPLAMLIVSFNFVDRSVMPWLVLSQTFPKVAVAPLLVVWFGLGFTPKILVTFLVAFFPIVLSSVIGLRSMDREMIELSASMKATTWQKFLRFQLPFALPFIFSGLKVAVSISVVGAVLGEWVGATKGLGYLLLVANATLDTSLLFAALIMLSVIGAALYYAVEWIERISIPWHVSRRMVDTRSSRGRNV